MPDYLMPLTGWILALGSFLLTILLTPLVSRVARRVGAVDPGGYRKINTRPVPLLGGLAVAVPFLLLCMCGLLPAHTPWLPLRARLVDFVMLLIGSGAILGLGVYDDIKGLDARNKFIVQIMVALLFCASGHAIKTIDLPVLGAVQLGSVLGSALTIIWIVGVINAFNLIDGLDGLATGLALISLIGLGIIAALNGAVFILVLSLALSGSLFGFLQFNFHPAQIFLGDTGSLFLGFVLAALSLMGSAKTSGAITLMTPLLALGLPIFDTMTSLARRILRGRNPFLGDCAHTHHRLLEFGFNQPQAVMILYGLALICVVTAILCQIFLPSERGSLYGIGLYGLMVIGLARLNGYLRPRQILRVAACRKRNQKLAAFSQYAMLTLNADGNTAGLEDVLRLGCRELSLRYLMIEFEDDPEFAAFLWPENGRGEESLEEDEGDPVETVFIHTGDHRAMRIHYQLNHWPRDRRQMTEDERERDKLEHQDVMACLAYLFDHAPVDRLAKVARRMELSSESLAHPMVRQKAASLSRD